MSRQRWSDWFRVLARMGRGTNRRCARWRAMGQAFGSGPRRPR